MTQTPLKLNGPLTTRAVAGPAWAANQPIYEVNLDSYGFPKGTALREYEKHLPVLKRMGVGLLWFMPLHPRGQKKAFGSPYSVRDYMDISPEVGHQRRLPPPGQKRPRAGPARLDGLGA